MKKIILLFSFILLCISCSRKITCDKFIVNTELQDDKLYLNIDSDLPDFTDIIVSVSRSYWEKGKPNEYSIKYSLEDFNKNTYKKATLAIWKNPQNILFDKNNWIAKLKLNQKSMNYYNSLDKISDSISVSVEVPLKQSNSAFGENNINLIGEQVSKNHTIKRDILVNCPLTNKKELLFSDSYKIIFDCIPKDTHKDYISFTGRVNPKYSLFINNEKEKLKDTTDKFYYSSFLKEGNNIISIKLFNSLSKCIYEKDFNVKYLNFKTTYKDIKTTYKDIKTTYIENCKSIDFRYLKKNPKSYVGTQVKFEGKVIEIAEDNNGSVLAIAVKDGYKSYNYSHRLYVITKKNTNYIVEDDIIKVYGKIIGESNNITWDDSPIMMMEHCWNDKHGYLF